MPADTSIPSRVLPREGLTQEALYAPFRLTALNPLFTGPLLLAILRYPEHVDKLRSFLSPALNDVLARWGPTPKTLKWLFAFGALRVINNWLSRKTVNNWVTDKTYDWDKEIVIVTGGSSGIGNLVVRDLANRGIKVICLDLNEPKEPLRMRDNTTSILIIADMSRSCPRFLL